MVDAHYDQAERTPIADRIVLAVTILLPSLVTYVYFVLLAGESSVLQQASYVLGKVVQFGLPIVWVFLVRRQPIRRPVLLLNGVMSGSLFALVVTGIAFAAYTWVLKPTGLFDSAAPLIRAKVSGVGIQSLWQYVVLSLFYAGVHSLLEEYYWRWFVFGRLRQLVRLPTAITVSAIGFAAHHVIVLSHYFGAASAATWMFSLAVAVGGAVWAWLYHANRSLVAPWISHLILDAGIFLIGYDLVRDTL